MSMKHLTHASTVMIVRTLELKTFANVLMALKYKLPLYF